MPVIDAPFTGVSPVIRRRALSGESPVGLRERVRARRSVLESGLDSSSLSFCFLFSSEMEGGEDRCCLADTDRVTRRDSTFSAIERSDGVGDGEVTRGVAGTAYWADMTAEIPGALENAI